MAGVDRDRLDQAILQLTFGRRGSMKLKTLPYQLRIWAFPSAETSWDDASTWKTAPANDVESASGMEDPAVLLTTYDLPANPDIGDRLQISAKPLLDFIRGFEGEELTLVLTGDDATDHKTGWRITSTEDAGRFPPPTLILKAK